MTANVLPSEPPLMGTILVPLFAHYRATAPLVQAAYGEGLPFEKARTLKETQTF